MENNSLGRRHQKSPPSFTRALLFGQNESLQEMLGLLLSEMGLSTKSVQGQRCGTLPSELNPVIIIIDCTIPGDEKQSEAVNFERTVMIPVIILSTYTVTELDYNPKDHQIFLEKPFSLKEFTGSVHMLLNGNE